MAEEQVHDQDVELPDSPTLSMSDEELLSMSPQEWLAKQKKFNGDEKPEKEQTAAEEPAEESEPELEASEEKPEEPVYEPQATAEPESDAGADPEADRDEEEVEARSSGSEDVYEETEETEVQETQAQEEQIDYKAEYERLLAPFRAVKREVKITNVDDARNLMQMGADYQVKMQALKPKINILRTLERAELLDENKLNFLIDLDKGNPEAIKRYLKEKKIDPMDLDMEAESSYQPTKHVPSDAESALDDALDQIRDTDTFDRTVEELGNKWDGPSKDLLMKHPQLIPVINDHIGKGIYDQIMNIIANERMLGRLVGVNDLMAYKQVGDALQSKGAFKHLNGESKPKTPKKGQDPKLKARKRAASPTKRSNSGQAASVKDFNPLALSDEEFEKMAKPTFQ